MTETANPPVATETEAPPGFLWVRMKADPAYAAEHLALEAVRLIGPEATDWVRRMRDKAPDVLPEQLAAFAVSRFTTLARISGSVSGATGLSGAVLDIGVLAWTQARMLLHVAAAYGLDSAAGERAAELLVLQGAHKTPEAARVALGVAAGRERATRVYHGIAAPTRNGVMLKLGVRLGRMAGIRATKRLATRMVPATATVLGCWVNSAATRDLADRTRAYYRNLSR